MPIKLHDEVFDFLEQYRSKHPDFVYWLRERNTRNRLADGYWVLGNDNYTFVGLYDRAGGSNMTKSIGLVFYYDQDDEENDVLVCYLELVYNEEKDNKVIQFYQEVMKLIGGFEKVSETKYRKALPGEGPAAAEKFLNIEKLRIDALLRQMKLDELFIDKKEFEEKLKNILIIRGRQNGGLFPTAKIEELKKKYEVFKQHEFYKQRIPQLNFIPFAQQVIILSLDGELTNETFTGLIQILKNGARLETVNQYIDKNITVSDSRIMLKKMFAGFDFTGYTGAGKAGINGLTDKQLEATRKFILDCRQIKTIEEATKRVEAFEELAIPQIRTGVYSPWLYYLNPSIFPIKNNSHDGFISWCGQPTDSYPVVIRLFHEVSEILGEKDLGLIDAFTHMFTTDEEADTPPIINRNETYSMSLNTILYGPPGTGKTYHTINKAVAIANPEYEFSGKTRKQIKAEFDRLKSLGQVEFVTFHQSMNYEDFIEGIKPLEPQEGDPFLKYKVQPGVFKRLVARAEFKPSAQSSNFSLTEDQFKQANFFKISLGNTAIPEDDQIYRYCIDNGYIALGRGDANDFTGLSEGDIQKMVPEQLESYSARSVNYFIHYLKKGDYVVVTYGNLWFRAIGRVTGDYEFKNVEGLDVKQFRKVEWLIKDEEIPVEELYYKQFQQQTIYNLNKAEIKKDFFVKAEKGNILSSPKKKDFVLIIDEINRGNIAQIFGELITLIEEDKRKGRDEALEVTLPYSGEPFSVPDNIYIIGTMNTADRSVEALDSALRRRFSFIEMQAEETHPDISSNVSISGIRFDFQEVLATINKRIEKLSGRDHKIGHSYFIHNEKWTWQNYLEAFSNKIIPLLQEYFYGDYAKMCLVVGKGFVDIDIAKSDDSDARFFAAAEHDAIDSFMEKAVWQVKTIKSENDFANALTFLLNK